MTFKGVVFSRLCNIWLCSHSISKCYLLPPLQVTASQLSACGSKKCSILILADSDQEKNKWVGLLNELHRLLKKNKLKERSVYVPKEAYDSTLPLIKTTQSAAILGAATTP